MFCRLWPASEQHACIRMSWRPGVGGARVETEIEGTVDEGDLSTVWPKGILA